jgi:hypothetical protein
MISSPNIFETEVNELSFHLFESIYTFYPGERVGVGTKKSWRCSFHCNVIRSGFAAQNETSISSEWGAMTVGNNLVMFEKFNCGARL